MHYPQPLKPGSTIAISAISSGVASDFIPRLELAKRSLEAKGFTLVEGQHVRTNNGPASAPAKERAAELMQFLTDDSIDAVMPPWGGEFAMDMLPHIDYEALSAQRAKWLIGFSDVSTLAMALTTRCFWASVHSSNLMQFVPSQRDALTAKTFDYLTSELGSSFTQQSSSMYEISPPSIVENPDAPFNLSKETQWHQLATTCDQTQISGRIVGGCLDTLCLLAGTHYFDLHRFADAFPNDGLILYLENAEMTPTSIVRALTKFKLLGYFDRITGLVLGRNAASDSNTTFGYLDALKYTLSDTPFPVFYDADIGHVAPNMTLINGAIATINVEEGKATVSQHLS